jgi:hypothetical protein
MTHPNHQGKGLFTKLAKLTYDLAKEEGIEFIFGFPNKNSYPGFIKKLNWVHYNDIVNYKIKIRTFPLDKFAKKIKLFNFFYEKIINIWLSKYQVNFILKNSLNSQNEKNGCLVHDKDFYNYKTYYKTYTIEVGNKIAVIKIDGRLWVGDIEICDELEFYKFDSDLKKIAKKIGCSSIVYSVFKNSKYDLLLSSNYSSSSENPVGYLNLSRKINPDVFAYQALDFDTF